MEEDENVYQIMNKIKVFKKKKDNNGANFMQK